MKHVRDFLGFVNNSPSPYHAVNNVVAMLKDAGYSELAEKESWDGHIKPGSHHFVVRNGSSIVALATGGKWKPGNGVAVVGAHTDSPCLRIKPQSSRSSNGYDQVGVEIYGGGLWPTWFDRDLSIAGRVFVTNPNGGSGQKLIHIRKPLLRIPTLAIHLHREQGTKLEFNKETHLEPIVGLVKKSLGVVSSEEGPETAGIPPVTQRHGKGLLDAVAQAAGCKVEDIQDFELVLYDTQEAVVGGLNDEFIFAPRQDNLNSSYCAIKGLLEAGNLAEDESIRAVALFDHEEVGSVSTHGAASNFLEAVISRLAGSTKPFESLAKSFLLSADMAHAVHPNYAAKHETKHAPAINAGPVIKINANQRYATNSPGIILLEAVAKKANVPLQLFVVRNDSTCGSTIGPIMASRLGIRTLDLGSAQLSMHSIRETAGTDDVGYAVDLFKSFFENFTQTEANIEWLP